MSELGVPVDEPLRRVSAGDECFEDDGNPLLELVELERGGKGGAMTGL